MIRWRLFCYNTSFISSTMLSSTTSFYKPILPCLSYSFLVDALFTIPDSPDKGGVGRWRRDFIFELRGLTYVTGFLYHEVKGSPYKITCHINIFMEFFYTCQIQKTVSCLYLRGRLIVLWWVSPVRVNECGH